MQLKKVASTQHLRNKKHWLKWAFHQTTTLCKLIWADHPKQNVSDFVGTVVRNSVHFLMSFYLDNWQHWELNAQNHVFASNFSSYLHRRKRDVKLTAGLIRHAIYIVAYTANINSLLIGWLTDWLTDRLTDRLTCWWTDWPTDWLADWLIDYLTDWLRQSWAY